MGGVARGPSSLVLQPGESALLRFWDGDVSRQRDWQEDAPRAITIQPISRQRGWRPVNGVVVNQPGTSVLRLERAAGPPAGLLQPFARSVVCDVELHDRGTRLTLRSMATVVNQTQRTLAVDLEHINDAVALLQQPRQVERSDARRPPRSGHRPKVADSKAPTRVAMPLLLLLAESHRVEQVALSLVHGSILCLGNALKGEHSGGALQIVLPRLVPLLPWLVPLLPDPLSKRLVRPQGHRGCIVGEI